MLYASDEARLQELILIVDPKAGIRVKEGQVISLVDGVDVTPLRELLNVAEAAIRPLYGVSEDWLKYRISSDNILMGYNQPLDLSIFYKISGPLNVLRLLPVALRQIPFVQAAYLKPLATLPVVFERREMLMEVKVSAQPSPNFIDQQEYLKPAAEGGIDAIYAWNVTGGLGTNVKMVDVEGGWCFTHEDLVENPSGCIAGVSISDQDWRDHGTAVLGMLGADHNDIGVKGICPCADVRTSSIFQSAQADPTDDGGSAAAIRAAADALSAGDIMLIELHRPGPAVNFQANEQTQEGYIPVEWWPCDMGAILYATGRGIIVISAAGNGQQNLCDDIYNQNPPDTPGPFPDWWVNPFKRNPVDTQSILVGSGLPPFGIHGSRFGPERSRFERSNFGKVVDTQAWGAEVATCGFNGDLTPDEPEVRRYTRRFNGTSSASAMVAGAVCCLQGVAKAKQKLLTPLKVRTLLRDNSLGEPQQNGPLGPAQSQPIGPRPDLKRLIGTL